MKKEYVNVELYYKSDGTIIPRAILWSANQRYDIDRVLNLTKCVSDVGGAGDCYLVRIHDQQRKLFYDEFEKKWFIESEK